MYAIYSEDKNCFFNVGLEDWVDEFDLEGDCLFPTSQLAQNYINDVVKESDAKVYQVEIQTTGSYEYSPVN